MIIREKKKRFRIVLLSSGRLRGCACAIVTCEGQGEWKEKKGLCLNVCGQVIVNIITYDFEI